MTVFDRSVILIASATAISFVCLGPVASLAAQKPPNTQRAIAGSNEISDVYVEVPNRLLKTVRQLRRQLDYRAAEIQLLDYMRAVKRAAGKRQADRHLQAELGTLYLRSGELEQARDWLQQSYRQVRAAVQNLGTQRLTEQSRFNRGQMGRQLLADQSSVAMLLAEAHAGLGEPRQAAEVLRSAVLSYHSLRIDEPNTRVQLLVQLAKLGETTLVAGPPPITVEAEIKQISRELRIDRWKHVAGLVEIAEYQRLTGQSQEAMATLDVLLKDSDLGEHSLDRISVWKQAANLKLENGEIPAAINLLRGAQEFVSNQDLTLTEWRYQQAAVARLLGDALGRDRKREDAANELNRAQRVYLDLMRAEIASADRDRLSIPTLLADRADCLARMIELPAAKDAPPMLSEVIDAHEALLDQFSRALLPNDRRMARLQMTLGTLYLDDNKFNQATAALHAAETIWNANPKNYHGLVQTLNLLGETALEDIGHNDVASARVWFEQADEWCQLHLHDVELAARIKINLGRMGVLRGKYEDAYGIFKAVLKAGEQGSLSDATYSSASLQMGLLYIAMGQLSIGRKYCEEALEMRRRSLGDDALELLPYYLAMAALCVAQTDASPRDVPLTDGNRLEQIVARISEISEKLSPSDKRRLQVEHYRAMQHFLRGAGSASERAEARRVWQAVLQELDDDEIDMLAPRVRHYLARTTFLEWRSQYDEWLGQKLTREKQQSAICEKLRSDYEANSEGYAEDLKRHKDNREKYNSDVRDYNFQRSEQADPKKRHAELADRKKRLDEEYKQLTVERLGALNKLGGEVAAAESDLDALDARPDGALRNRWEKLLADGSNLAYEALRRLQDQRYPSLQYAVRCNLAQILEAQSQVSGAVEDRRTRAQNMLLKAIDLIEMPSKSTIGGDELRAEFFARYQTAYDLLVRSYAKEGKLAEAVIVAERARSRTLLERLERSEDGAPVAPPLDAREVVRQWITRKSVEESPGPVLYYYLGSVGDYLFVLGGPDDVEPIIPLNAARNKADSAGSSSPMNIEGVVSHLVEKLKDKDTTAAEIERSRMTLAGWSDVLLPRTVRNFLRERKARGASHVTVVPHGPLTQLPLEAMVVADEGFDDELYVADFCPPLTYAPSLRVMQRLQGPKGTVQDISRSRSLLTIAYPADHDVRLSASVCNAYDARNYPKADEVAMRDGRQFLLRLPQSREESNGICNAFKPIFKSGQIISLTTDTDATEGRLRSELDSHPIFVHLAAHGFAARQGIPFGFIALAAPPQAADRPVNTADDGILELGEIQQLPLKGCELVVLSACNTNLNRRDVPGDPSFSLASGFLAARSRRVIATQWEVPDKWASVLITDFMTDLATRCEALGDSGSINYAKCLADARGRLREKLRRDKDENLDTPYRWAPFVLLGPAAGTYRLTDD